MKLNKKCIRGITSFCVVAIAFVMCLGLSSITANAETLSNFNLAIKYQLRYNGVAKQQILARVDNNTAFYYENEPVYHSMDDIMEMHYEVTAFNNDDGLIATAGEKLTVSISNIIAGVFIDEIDYFWENPADFLSSFW